MMDLKLNQYLKKNQNLNVMHLTKTLKKNNINSSNKFN